MTRPVASVGTQPNARASFDLGEVQRDVGAGGAVRRDLRRDVVAGQDVAVEDQDRVVRARWSAAAATLRMPPPVPSGSVLGDVVELQAERGAVAECLGEDLGAVGRRQHDVVDAGVARPRPAGA